MYLVEEMKQIELLAAIKRMYAYFCQRPMAAFFFYVIKCLQFVY